MNKYFKPTLKMLPQAQRKLWPELLPSVQSGFVLYGGTAITLRLGHRSSVDFDFFTEKPLDQNGLQNVFPFITRSTVLQDQQDTLTLLVPCDGALHEQVKVSFFGGLHNGRVGIPELTEDEVLRVASLDDLMATKLKVLLQRVEAKDYKDIAALVKAGVSLAKGLASARSMYGRTFQPSECLKALVYFKGGDLNCLTQEDRETLILAAASVRDLPSSELVSKSLTFDEKSKHIF
ncbi:MAG: nucleotidyl transferase AbiEii/AbiGii toxin family protein [Gammaproteobacteria bacterium]|nr:nucleotidyl transferase AbiEii/AbiGii toxin family protein [Gammaproteobacteria bacterium]